MNTINQYTVVGFAASINTGIVQLTPAQAVRRQHALKSISTEKDNDLYEVLQPVMFKNGETFGYDGDIPKNLASTVVTPEVAKEIKKAEKAQPKPRNARVGR